MAEVLLVDDNEDNCTIYCLYLAHLGHTCHVARNGALGLQMASELLPDVILLDIGMPVMDGWEAIIALKALPSTASIPVIGLSAHALKEDEERAAALGFDRYLAKPIEPRDVIATIKEVLSTSGQDG